jgi:hypothetical protein
MRKRATVFLAMKSNGGNLVGVIGYPRTIKYLIAFALRADKRWPKNPNLAIALFDFFFGGEAN